VSCRYSSPTLTRPYFIHTEIVKYCLIVPLKRGLPLIVPLKRGLPLIVPLKRGLPLIVPLKRGHPSYITIFPLQKRWFYKRGTTVL
jgi:hypothetical protein